MTKRLFSLFLTGFLCVGCLQAQGAKGDARHNFSLFSFTHKQLTNYYRRDNFADPNHQNGWYRVHDFLTWVKQNEAELTDIYQKKYSDKYTNFPPINQDDVSVLAGFLGMYYTGSHCKKSLKQLNVMPIVLTLNSSASTREIQIGINDSFVQTVNSGLHEAAHAIPFFCYAIPAQDPGDNLSELIPLSAQLIYGLPTQPSDIPQGTRSVVGHLKGNDELSDIYAQELLAFLQYNSLREAFQRKDLHPFTSAKLERSSFTLDLLVQDLIDVHHGKLLLNGRALTLQDYLRLLHVQQRELGNVSAFLENFLRELDKAAALPKSTKTRAWKEYTKQYEKYLRKNTPVIKSILLKLLQPYKAPPTPKGFA